MKRLRFVGLFGAILGILPSAEAQVPRSVAGGTFTPGGQVLFATDFSQDALGSFPSGLRHVRGPLEVVQVDGVHMLRSIDQAEFIIPLAQPLPQDFTLEFDLITRNSNCCAGEELAFEGSPQLARTSGSAWVAWHHQYAGIIGGGQDLGTSTVRFSEELQRELLGQRVRIQVRMSGTQFTLFTNGRQIYNIPTLQFRRSKVLRVFLGGLDDGDRAVYLAAIRLAGGPSVVAGAPAGQPTLPEAAPSPGARTATVVPPPPPTLPEAAPVSGARTPTVVTPPTSILVGTGISDITGPIAEAGMMGYAKFEQLDMGLHTRLFARAFIFANPNGKRVVFVSAELAMLFSSVKQGVLKQLAARYGSLYNDRNVMLSATHTHSGPGGFSHHVQFNLTTWGHIAQNYAAIVDGITEAIVQADSSLAPATVAVAAGDIPDPVSVNRSMAAYTLNPDARAVAPPASTAPAGPRPLVPAPPPSPSWPDSVTREMTVLGIQRNGVPAGAISWFAVHNTSIGQYNRLVSSDHKGYAAFLFERQYGTIAPFLRPGAFVAAFPNGAEGDMSPNLDVSNPKQFRGPGSNEFESSRIIGEREFNTATRLFAGSSQTPVVGDVDFRHAFVLMPGLLVTSTNHTNGVGLKFLCPGAYGVSFMAGAEDGPTGMLGEGLAFGSPGTFTFADLTAARAAIVLIVGGIPIVGPVLAAVLTPLMATSSDPCQDPKPVLIPSGALHWTPDILPFQLLRIGPVAIAGIPGEMTLQAGRRLQARILTSLAPLGVQRVILTGLANEYSGYITTPEEYGSQQYEGASTLYGRLTFDAYLQEFGKLADAMAGGQAVAAGPTPPDLSVGQLELAAGAVRDEVPAGESFGQVLTQPPPTVARTVGAVVRVTFRSGHPKNDLRRNNTYFRIERDNGTDNWELVAWDAMPETKLYWDRPTDCPGNPCYWSRIDVHWNVPLDAPPGTYRIRLVGSWKNGSNGQLVRYQGTTRLFTVQ